MLDFMEADNFTTIEDRGCHLNPIILIGHTGFQTRYVFFCEALG